VIRDLGSGSLALGWLRLATICAVAALAARLTGCEAP